MCGIIPFPESAKRQAEETRKAEESAWVRRVAIRAMFRALTFNEFVQAQLANMSRRQARTWSEGKKLSQFKMYKELYEKCPERLPKYLLRRIEE